jgi:hypothetical protein
VEKIIKAIDRSAIKSGRFVCHDHKSLFDRCSEIENILRGEMNSAILSKGHIAKMKYDPKRGINDQDELNDGLMHVLQMANRLEEYHESYVRGFFSDYFQKLKEDHLMAEEMKNLKPTEEPSCFNEEKQAFDVWMKGEKGGIALAKYLKTLCYSSLSEPADDREREKKVIKGLVERTKMRISPQLLAEWEEAITCLKKNGSGMGSQSAREIITEAGKKFL